MIRHWAIFLTNSRKSSRVVKTGISVSMETFGWKFFAKLTICYFFEYRAEKVRLAVEKSQRGFQVAFYLSIGTFWRKKIWKVFALFVNFFRINSGNWAGKFSRPVKTAFFVSIQSFWRKNYFGKQMKFCIIFRQWAGRFRLLVEFFEGDVRTAFYVSKTTF